MIESLVEPGVYSHHRGGHYSVLFLATDSTNSRAGKPVVVYVSMTTGERKVRELIEFLEPVQWPDGTIRPRFRRLQY
jgi:hypothetical protein